MAYFNFTINGNTYTNDPTSGLPYGYKFAGYEYIPALGNLFTDLAATVATVLGYKNAAYSSQQAAATSEGNASNYAGAALASAVAAASAAAGLQGTSTTAVTIGTGTKTFTTQSGKQFNNTWVQATDSGDVNRWVFGYCTYSGTTLSMTVANATDANGSGSCSSWVISVGGPRGLIGPTGSVGALQTASDFAYDPATSSGLNIGTKAGDLRSDATTTHINATTTALTNNTTNYVQVNASGVSANTTGFTPGYFPIGTAVTSGGVITSFTDKRGIALLMSSAALNKLTRTSNTILASGDSGKYITASTSFTQTFDTAANLGAGWFVWYANNGTGDITIAASDGISNWVMYPGAVRLFQCDGTNLTSIPLRAGSRTFSSSGNHAWPPGIATCFVQALGAGGGGASGYYTSGSNGQGGPGGGGGEYLEGWIKGVSAGTATTVTIGAGGAGGPARTSSNSPAPGSNGGQTTFGTLVKAAAGGGGGSSSPGLGGGLTIASAKPTGAIWLTGHGTISSNFDVGTDAAGAFGGNLSSTTGIPGYRSLRGGGGGGSGGAIDGALNPYAGGAGGATGRNASALTNNTGGGGAGGASGVAGSAGTQPTDSIAGHGGGGGGSVTSGTGGSGGAGGLGAGGGGGGAVSTGTSGAGGVGGNGVCIVTEII